MSHWRLHLVVCLSTFALFPLLGLAMHLLVPGVMTSMVYLGFLYLFALPATVQSSIAFTSATGGNVAAAICSASASSILGLFLSPLLVGALIFVVGYLIRPQTGKWVDRHRKLINITDRSSRLLVVYSACSAAIVENLWHKIDGWSLLTILMMSLPLLAVVMMVNTYAARWLGFDTADEITIVFCGSKKSLENRITMANVLFPAATVGSWCYR